MNDLSLRLQQYSQSFVDWLTSIQLTAQIGIVAASIVLTYLLAAVIKTRLKAPKALTASGAFRDLAENLNKVRALAFPVLLVLLLAAAMEAGRAAIKHIGFVQIALGLSVIFLVHQIINQFIRTKFIIALTNWVALPVALLLVFGWLDDVTAYLDRYSIEVGSIRVSAYALARTLFFGAFLFWLGRISNSTGKRVIRSRPDFDSRTREILTKLFEISLFVIIALILLQVMGINFTTLAVFGGALGVGLGFGLQQIAANFISGIIILLDKSIKPGDTITLGDTFGWIRELRARFVSVITRDGREYLIPNEDFITQQVINWSFSDEMVRLDVPFGVSYEADPHQVSALAIEAAISVGRVDADRRPVCWLTGFGDSSLDFVLRFWIRDPQQGLTNVRGKVLLALWDTLKENGIEIPYPHREVIMKQPPTGPARPATGD